MNVATEDAGLWQAFKEGDREAFRSLYFFYFSHLYEYGMRLVNNADRVKDGIHDLFVKLWNNRANLSQVIAVRPYLLVALRTTLYNRLERDNRITLTGEAENLPFDLVFSVESAYIQKETHSVQAQQLIAALNQLTPRQKEVLYLRYFEELPYEEIAALMSITVKATYKLSARGLDALRDLMKMNGPSLLFLLLLVKAEWLNLRG